MGFEIEATVDFDFFETPVLGAAAITGERFAHHDVQDEVDERCCEQYRERPKHLVVRPGDATADKADNHQRHAQALREIFASVEISAGANQAAVQSLTSNRFRWNRDLLPTMGAAQRRRFGRDGFSDRLMTCRAVVSDVHRNNL